MPGDRVSILVTEEVLANGKVIEASPRKLWDM
jgi:hypothetical protein